MHLNAFKLDDSAQVPEFATTESCMFDLRACFYKDVVKCKNCHYDEGITVEQKEDGKKFIRLYPGSRALIPTGLIFLIPVGYHIKIYPRSSMPWKRDLILYNNVGIIDSDYIHETFVMIKNESDMPVSIYDGERIAQFEMVRNQDTGVIFEVYDHTFKKHCEEVKKNSDREGGFGSTGT